MGYVIKVKGSDGQIEELNEPTVLKTTFRSHNQSEPQEAFIIKIPEITNQKHKISSTVERRKVSTRE
jgi:hypothetical protein